MMWIVYPFHPPLPKPEVNGEVFVDRTAPEYVVLYWEGGPIVRMGDREVENAIDKHPGIVEVTLKGLRIGPWFLEYLHHEENDTMPAWVCINWEWERKMDILTYDVATGEYI